MRYKVLIGYSIYCEFSFFSDWYAYRQYNSDKKFDEYVRKCFPEVFDYIDKIDQARATRMNDILDIDYNLDQSSEYDNFARLFTFKSEEHYTWFKLKYS